MKINSVFINIMFKLYGCVKFFVFTLFLVVSTTKGFARDMAITRMGNLTTLKLQPNSRYVIDSHIDLNGQVLSVPDNCLLEFKGGSIRNGTIVGCDTRVMAPRKIIFTTCKILGTWTSDAACPEWFGAVGDGETDDTYAIEISCKFHNVKLKPNTRYAIQNIEFEDIKNISIIGDNSKLLTKLQNTDKPFNILGNQNIESKEQSFDHGIFHIKGVNIDAKVQDYVLNEPPNPNGFNALALDNYRVVKIENCEISNTLMCGIRATICDTVIVRNCIFKNIGYDRCPINNGCWQWEAVSLTGYRFVNGNPHNCIYKHCSLLLVEHCSFYNILNSIVGCMNTSNVIVRNNICDRLHSYLTEFHINNNKVESIDSININENKINRIGGAIISFSGTFDENIITHINISKNIIKKFNGEELPKYHIAKEDAMRHLLLLYRDRGESNIEVDYNNNEVYSVNNSSLDTYVLISGIRKVTISNSIFDIYGRSDGMSTILYAPNSEVRIKNCKFYCNTKFSDFLKINKYGCEISKTHVKNLKPCSSILSLDRGNTELLENVDINQIRIGICKQLCYFRELPRILVIDKAQWQGNLISTDLTLSKRKKIDYAKIIGCKQNEIMTIEKYVEKLQLNHE